MTVTSELAETLAMVAQAAHGSEDDWWIIGSAAVSLLGGEVGAIKDVDLLMTVRDAEAMLRRVGASSGGALPDEKFRSEVFGVWREPPIPVEIFGGFALGTNEGWRDVVLSTRQSVTVSGTKVFVPTVEELTRLLHSFGRPKDLERASLLQASCSRNSPIEAAPSDQAK